MPDLFLPEALLRGAAIGMLLLSAVLAMRGDKGFGVEALGSVFFVATAAYAAVSSPSFQPEAEFVRLPLVALATLNSVFFWWFATALFDDDFRWRWWRFVPFVAITGLFVLRQVQPEQAAGVVESYVQHAIVIAMMLHVLWVALAHRRDDLEDRRRAFRLVFAAMVGLFGLMIAGGEIAFGQEPAPRTVLFLHAAGLSVLTFGFTAWIFPPVTFLPRRSSNGQAPSSDMPRLDRADLERLTQLMKDGAYRQEGLTIGSLAEQVNLPEYRLRRLINGGLGFRNFSAFLNAYRLAEAQTILANPQQARRQITQIALDLGYGSIGPFNRAFKAATNCTPTEFRRMALSEGTDVDS